MSTIRNDYNPGLNVPTDTTDPSVGSTASSETVNSTQETHATSDKFSQPIAGPGINVLSSLPPIPSDAEKIKAAGALKHVQAKVAHLGQDATGITTRALQMGAEAGAPNLDTLVGNRKDASTDGTQSADDDSSYGDSSYGDSSDGYSSYSNSSYTNSSYSDGSGTATDSSSGSVSSASNTQAQEKVSDFADKLDKQLNNNKCGKNDGKMIGEAGKLGLSEKFVGNLKNLAKGDNKADTQSITLAMASIKYAKENGASKNEIKAMVDKLDKDTQIMADNKDSLDKTTAAAGTATTTYNNALNDISSISGQYFANTISAQPGFDANGATFAGSLPQAGTTSSGSTSAPTAAQINGSLPYYGYDD